MNPKRKNRMFAVIFLLVGVGAAVAVLLFGVLNENMNVFYPPDEVVSGKAPKNTNIRAGGMVADGSLVRGAASDDGLSVSFVLTDYQGADFKVYYSGILPDLFREGQGILVAGQLDDAGEFQAREVLAKHDENYMPPELADLTDTEGERAAKKPNMDSTYRKADYSQTNPALDISSQKEQGDLSGDR